MEEVLVDDKEVRAFTAKTAHHCKNSAVMVKSELVTQLLHIPAPLYYYAPMEITLILRLIKILFFSENSILALF